MQEPGDLPSSEQFETTVHECEAIAFKSRGSGSDAERGQNLPLSCKLPLYFGQRIASNVRRGALATAR